MKVKLKLEKMIFLIIDLIKIYKKTNDITCFDNAVDLGQFILEECSNFEDLKHDIINLFSNNFHNFIKEYPEEYTSLNMVFGPILFGATKK